ncbi:MAG TPA: hypothetical protein VF815_28005 [Myxococcaceae bacterium]|jgi:hypothetical protein
MDSLENPVQQQPTPAPEAQERPRRKRTRAPLSEEQQRRKTARQAVNRELERVLSEGSTEEIERTLQRLRMTADEATSAPEPLAQAPELSSASSARQPPPGWPTDEATEKARPIADGVVTALSLGVSMLGVDLTAARPGPTGAPFVPSQELSKALAPVVALYAPDVLLSPVGNLAVTAVSIATLVLAEFAMKRLEQQHHQATATAIGAGTATPPSPVASA